MNEAFCILHHSKLRRSTSETGHERRFRRKLRTSAFPPIADIIAASHRLASYQSDPRRDKADRGERHQAAGADCCGENWNSSQRRNH
jgi:hypothetical protein